MEFPEHWRMPMSPSRKLFHLGKNFDAQLVPLEAKIIELAQCSRRKERPEYACLSSSNLQVILSRVLLGINIFFHSQKLFIKIEMNNLEGCFLYRR